MCVCSNIRFDESSFDRFTVCRSVCWLRPDNRLAIASGNHEKSFSHGRRAVIRCYKFLCIDRISKCFQLLSPFFVCLSASFRIRLKHLAIHRNNFSWICDSCTRLILLSIMSSCHIHNNASCIFIPYWNTWSPCLEFFHIFKHNNSWSNKRRPFKHNPRKTANILFYRFSAFSLREVFAVR